MGYFPFFVELQETRGLVVGGGKIACHKVEKLLPYGPRLTVVAPEVIKEISDLKAANENRLAIMRRKFAVEDLEEKQFVIAAADDSKVNCTVANLCRERNILINSVDDKENCSFYFPALITCGKLSVGISTGGASPTAAAYMKELIAEVIPDHMEEILDFLYGMRSVLKEIYPEDRKQRMHAAKAMFAACLERCRPLSEEEWKSILEEEKCAGAKIKEKAVFI